MSDATDGRAAIAATFCSVFNEHELPLPACVITLAKLVPQPSLAPSEDATADCSGSSCPSVAPRTARCGKVLRPRRTPNAGARPLRAPRQRAALAVKPTSHRVVKLGRPDAHGIQFVLDAFGEGLQRRSPHGPSCPYRVSRRSGTTTSATTKLAGWMSPSWLQTSMWQGIEAHFHH